MAGKSGRALPGVPAHGHGVRAARARARGTARPTRHTSADRSYARKAEIQAVSSVCAFVQIPILATSFLDDDDDSYRKQDIHRHLRAAFYNFTCCNFAVRAAG